MSRQRTVLPVLRLLAIAGWAAACGDGAMEPSPPPPEPSRATTVAVTPATAELTALGATVRFSAEVRDQNGNVMAGAAVSWSSSAASVATVDDAGLVTAVADGTATITAASGGVSGAAAATVTQAPDSVAVSPAEALIAASDTARLAAHAFDANGHAVAGAEFSWESSAASVATVEAAGLVTAVGDGTAAITASAGSASGSAVVRVVDFTEVLQRFIDAHGIGAAALGIMNQGKIVYDETVGYMDTQRQVPVGQNLTMRLGERHQTHHRCRDP